MPCANSAMPLLARAATFPSTTASAQCATPTECRYWAYHHLQNGEWVYSDVGASSWQVSNGTVDGWGWGLGVINSSGTQPPEYTFAQICAAELQPAATPTPTLTPTSTPTSTNPPHPHTDANSDVHPDRYLHAVAPTFPHRDIDPVAKRHSDRPSHVERHAKRHAVCPPAPARAVHKRPPDHRPWRMRHPELACARRRCHRLARRRWRRTPRFRRIGAARLSPAATLPTSCRAGAGTTSRPRAR